MCSHINSIALDISIFEYLEAAICGLITFVFQEKADIPLEGLEELKKETLKNTDIIVIKKLEFVGVVFGVYLVLPEEMS